jgi:nitrite reductase/ring-hydroxylating ferredoxin subunit
MVHARNINSYFIHREGGRLYGIAKTCQHKYDDAI